MTATGYLYRRLVRHPAASATRTGQPATREDADAGHPRPEPAGARPAVCPQAPAGPPYPEASQGRDARRGREIAEYLPYARYLAARFGMPAGSGDVARVARLGLAEAVDGFDPDSGTTLLANATRAIRDQVRRHLRDTARSTRAPRRIEELADALPGAVETMSRRLNRSPTVTEVAVLLDTCAEVVVDAIEAADSRAWQPPAWPVFTGADDSPRPDTGEVDIEHFLDIDRIRTLSARLSRRDKQILLRRFLRVMSRTQVCDDLGASPVYVDRLVSAFLAELRGNVTETGRPTAPTAREAVRAADETPVNALALPDRTHRPTATGVPA